MDGLYPAPKSCTNRFSPNRGAGERGNAALVLQMTQDQDFVSEQRACLNEIIRGPRSPLLSTVNESFPALPEDPGKPLRRRVPLCLCRHFIFKLWNLQIVCKGYNKG